MEKINNVTFLNEDFLEHKTKEKILKEFPKKVDVVISDMAADTTGNKSLDCIRTNLLCSEVIAFATEILNNKGVLLSKLFMGEDFLEVKELAEKNSKKFNFLSLNQAEVNRRKHSYIVHY